MCIILSKKHMCVGLIGAFLLGVLAKLRKVTVSLVISVCLSVRMEQLSSNWTDFHEN